MRALRTKVRAGFTLIELLTVIAIIAVLAAILFPVLSAARGRARKTTCMSNLMQLGHAITEYEQDYAGFLPTWSISNPRPSGPPSQPNSPGSGVVTWDISLGSYIKDNRILVCKSNPNAGSYGAGADANTARAYAIAQYTQRWTSDSAPAYGVFKDSIPAPTKTIMLFEKGANLPGSWGDALGQNVGESHGPSDNGAMFHYEGKNFLYVDGHVKWDKKTAGAFAYQSSRTGASPGDVAVPGKQKADGSGGDWPDPD